MIEFENFVSVKPLEGTLVIYSLTDQRFCFYQDRGEFVESLILSSDKLIREKLEYNMGADWEFEIKGATIFNDGETDIYWMDA
jgi:hypothetical protein